MQPIRHSDTTPDAGALELARRLEQSVSLGPAPWADTVSAGCFRAFFSPHSPYAELNYAMPVALPAQSGDLAAAVEDLRHLFAARRRTLRVEFVEELWTGLADVLERAGLTLAAREPLMACAPAEFQPAAAPGVAVRALVAGDPDAALAAFIAIRDEEELEERGRMGQPQREEIAQLRQAIGTSGGWFALGRLDGEPAGTGRCQASGDGLGELTAIVTVRALRRRGVAATVTSYLVRQHFANGGTLAWLSAANVEARAVYVRVGFREIGSLLNYEEPATADLPAKCFRRVVAG
jgi:predicted GNAT family acetyltransferase